MSDSDLTSEATVDGRIENASLAASETHRSWKHRCYAVMGALGFDYGDPDWAMPDEVSQAKTLRRALGYVENGTDTVVKIFQDDATRDWIIKAGKTEVYARSLSQAFDKLAAALPEED